MDNVWQFCINLELQFTRIIFSPLSFVNMKKSIILLSVLVCFVMQVFSQSRTKLSADRWVDSVFESLSYNQKLAQLIIVRLSSIDPITKKITFYDKEVEDAVRNFNVGGICLFQGGPVTQAGYINFFQ